MTKAVHLTIDTEIQGKRNNMISELITFRIMKAKVKEHSGRSEFTLLWPSFERFLIRINNKKRKLK